MQAKPNGLDRYLLWILLVGLVLRITLFVIAQPWTPKGEDTILHGSRDSLSFILPLPGARPSDLWSVWWKLVC
jgi:hypothetical protein